MVSEGLRTGSALRELKRKAQTRGSSCGKSDMTLGPVLTYTGFKLLTSLSRPPPLRPRPLVWRGITQRARLRLGGSDTIPPHLPSFLDLFTVNESTSNGCNISFLVTVVLANVMTPRIKLVKGARTPSGVCLLCVCPALGRTWAREPGRVTCGFRGC